jgi:predicted house-cleaning NTP pyrophosphatase (Maf/HAM1 superfamily)
VFVEAISGSYSGVVGLPVFETVKLLKEAGIKVLESPAGAGSYT